MTDEETIRHVFRELRRSGHLDAVFRVLRDGYQQYRRELDMFLTTVMLTDEPKRADVYGLQAQMKTCKELLATMETLAAESAEPSTAGMPAVE